MYNIDFVFNADFYMALSDVLKYRFDNSRKDIFSIDELHKAGGPYTYFALDFLVRHDFAEPCLDNPTIIMLHNNYSMRGLAEAAKSAYNHKIKKDRLLNFGIWGFFLSLISLLIQFEPFIRFIKSILSCYFLNGCYN